MLVSEIFNQKYPTVTEDAKILDVAELLEDNNLEAIPVVNKAGLTVGLIGQAQLFSKDNKVYLPTYINLFSKTDFVMGGKDNLPYAAKKIMRTIASEVMDKRVFFAAADTPIEKLAAKMLEHGAVVAPVVDASNFYLGAITRSDLLGIIAGVKVNLPTSKRERYVDKEFEFVQNDFTSKFAYVAKARANIWLTTATVLFIIGFLAGVIYVANPDIFVRRLNNDQVDSY